MENTLAKPNKFVNFYNKIKNSNIIQTLTKFCSSIWAIALLGGITILTNFLGLELALYSFVAIYVIFVCLFCDDLLPIICLFGFCYVSPSYGENPGQTTTSVFYNTTGVAVVIIAIVCTIAILTRIGLDPNIGFKKLFTCKRALMWGILAIGIAYLLSGIGSESYGEVFGKNLLFAFIQFMSFFIIYFIFSASINWSKVIKDYLSWLVIILSVVVMFELGYIYCTQNVIQNGTILRGKLSNGWGTYNNIGAMIVLGIPFAFYLACTKKHTYLYLILATILLVGVMLSCSRSSMLGGMVIYLISLIVTFIKADNKKWFRISTGILVGVGVIVGIIFFDKILEIFKNVPTIVKPSDGGLSFNDSGRFEIYKNGLLAFVNNPIFGQTFYPINYNLYDHATLDSFSAFFPPRWHNTIVQLLASCGIVGMLAYGYHRYQTIKLFIKKPTLYKSFIALSILSLLAMSMLDCHMFNIGPVLIYIIMLTFAEYTPDTTKNMATQSQNLDDTNV